jgi:sugar/nucleoside kinase (ribokinase family)
VTLPATSPRWASGAAGWSRLAPGAVIPAPPVREVDTTGCGDAYSAGFITGICRGWDAVAAARLGTATAALVAQGLGSGATLVNSEQALAFAEAHAPILDGAAP